MSPESYGERIRKAMEVATNFDAHARENIARFNAMSDLLTDNLPLVEDLDRCNAALDAAGRPDLVIAERAEMMRVDTPEQVTSRDCNNFAVNFHIYTGMKEPEEGTFGNEVPIPVTRDELITLLAMPKIKSNEHWAELMESGDFPALRANNHTLKPAFQRMLVLFPDFTLDLVTRMSQPDKEHRILEFEPELFVAYQFMSRLVDTSDRGLAVDNGTPDDWYLCR